MFVKYFSQPGDVVVDCCGGAFTTALACRNLGRRFVGGDRSPVAIDVASRRLTEAKLAFTSLRIAGD